MRGFFRVLGGFALAAAPALAFGAPNAYIPVTGEDKVAVVDLATNKVITKINVGCGPEGVAFNRVATKVYITNVCDGTVSVIRTNDFTVESTVAVGTQPFGVATSASGQVAVATLGGSLDGASDSMTVIGATGAKPVTAGTAPSSVAYNPAGDKLYVSNFVDATISVIDTSRLIAIDTIHVGLNPTGLLMDPSGKRLYVMHEAFGVTGDNQVTVLDITGTPRTTAVIHLDGVPAWMALNPANTTLAVAKPFNRSVSIIDTGSSTLLFDVQVAPTLNPSGVAFSPDGKTLYVVNEGGGGFLISYDTTTWLPTNQVNLGSSPIALGNFIQPPPPSYHAPGAKSGLWWNSAESGWGINFTERHGNILATWFTYDENGKAKWYAVPNCVESGQGCSGSVYQVTGPQFFAVPTYDPSLRNVASVGNMSVNFTDNDTASMSFTVNGVSRTVAIKREIFDDGSNTPQGFTEVIDYTDMWWNPAEPGWGLAITQQNTTMFLAWYVYDENGLPDWFVVPNCQLDPTTQSFCGGLLYHTHGPKFATTFDPTAVTTLVAGNMRVDFTDPEHATFDGIAFGVPVHKTITRQLF